MWSLSLFPLSRIRANRPSDRFFDRGDATWGLGRITSQDKLTGSDLDLCYTYKYDSTAGAGAVVYVIGVFLSLTIQRTTTYCTQQTPASTPITPLSEGEPRGGRPLADTRTRTETAMGLTVLEPPFLNHTVLPKPLT